MSTLVLLPQLHLHCLPSEDPSLSPLPPLNTSNNENISLAALRVHMATFTVHRAGCQSPPSESNLSASSDNFMSTPSALQMSANSLGQCLHTNPRCVPLLTPGEIYPMAMHHLEMACIDYFITNKVKASDWVMAVLSGLMDLWTCDWVVTHGDCLAGLLFDKFIKELQKEFLPEGWDDKLHAKICNSCLTSSEPFTKWVNNIHHLNLFLQNSEYQFSDTDLRCQLNSLLDVDLWNWCKNHKIKEIVSKVGGRQIQKTRSPRLSSPAGSQKYECWPKSMHMRQALSGGSRRSAACIEEASTGASLMHCKCGVWF